jgi:hypothetical protein
MLIIINRRSAAIDPRLALVNGNKLLKLAREAVEQAERRVDLSPLFASEGRFVKPSWVREQ